MSVKVVLLKNGNLDDYLIGDVEELDEEPSCFIEKCYRIIDGNLEEYPQYADQRDLFLTSDSIFSIVDPSPEILKKYKSL
ncbi:hypothetical protein Syn7803C72_143 [Synechococcus phage ACG-2014d]|jgi:hypothetical protein|uniref:Uncharacterized protein n=1 Tax=Synechococcus phage ACG-2014d TaxID=1493509 RepID=A0A0E3HEL9_9CAUD|nr:hypothetical protein AAJ59_gp143 [Synechococcus phage ACG-2014d]YP_010355313.1 hypothetical protein M1M12_gp144 [Synechococcus phage ACG-2014d]AIX14755.1 hypothetical protein Syn7803C45_144 [Synechococcus phage ACG-2014d]AIX14974.1 hypothetical protein Syn7803C46_143 [Synechococcus phage ACG-2014d]AIX15401.1 hypothetical protein Syn7803C48_143 [Synechococcus phage ACG-2014d]AIX15620.1 hypothetical protein Syn7803C49_144 [Synechococcus phage ACG-2014d]AIX16049.1 hypothetical protein Syn7803